MSDFGRPAGNDDASLDAVLHSDRLVDALAAGQPVAAQDEADATLAALLGSWRDEMRWPPATGLVTEQAAVSALQAGLAEKQSTGRSRRGLSVVGAVAATVLGIGGFGAVVAGAGPGDALYGLRTMFFGAPKEVRTDQVALAAQTELNQVQDLIARGDWQAAQDKLVAVSTQVASVGDADQKQQLFDQWNQLSAKVVDRNPDATVAPGITYTVPPSATELVATPAPTTVPNTPIPPITLSTTPDSPSPGSSSPASPSEVTTSPSVPASTSPAQQTAPSTSPPTSAASSPTATPTSPAAATSTPATPGTTPTSAPPASTTAPPASTSSAPPASTSAAPASTSTTAARAATTTAAPATTTTAAPPVSTAAPAVTSTAVIQQSVASAPASAPSTAAPPTATPAAPALTTAVVPTTVVQQPATAVQPTAEPTRQQAPVLTTAVIVPVPAPQTGAGG